MIRRSAHDVNGACYGATWRFFSSEQPWSLLDQWSLPDPARIGPELKGRPEKAARRAADSIQAIGGRSKQITGVPGDKENFHPITPNPDYSER